MKHPSALTRRELVALVGVAGTALILGEGVIGTEALNHSALLSRTGDTAQPDPNPNPSSEGPAASASDEVPHLATTKTGEPEETLEESAAPSEPSLDDLPWNLRLVNKEHPLAKDFPTPELKDVADGYAVDERIHDDLVALLKAGEEAGRRPVVCSAYRSHKRQRELYRARVRQSKEEGKSGQEAKDDAAFWVAPPYASEHETGLAVDLVDASYQELDEKQETTATQRWLMKHCAKYGFILRYPTDKSDITGIGYEPWHYRYVGKEAASDIAESGLCFEEWLDQHLAS
ncbi:M15 family metallopeptidase [Eggerthellaceae bacterium 24-137]